jgi:hypothetical protein
MWYTSRGPVTLLRLLDHLIDVKGLDQEICRAINGLASEIADGLAMAVIDRIIESALRGSSATGRYDLGRPPHCLYEPFERHL